MPLLLLPFPFAAPAGSDCQELARALGLRLRQELFPRMTAADLARVREITLQTCREGGGRRSPPDPHEGMGEEGGDWFSHEAFHGKVPDKAGLRRLRRLKP